MVFRAPRASRLPATTLRRHDDFVASPLELLDPRHLNTQERTAPLGRRQASCRSQPMDVERPGPSFRRVNATGQLTVAAQIRWTSGYGDSIANRAYGCLAAFEIESSVGSSPVKASMLNNLGGQCGANPSISPSTRFCVRAWRNNDLVAALSFQFPRPIAARLQVDRLNAEGDMCRVARNVFNIKTHATTSTS